MELLGMSSIARRGNKNFQNWQCYIEHMALIWILIAASSSWCLKKALPNLHDHLSISLRPQLLLKFDEEWDDNKQLRVGDWKNN